MSKLVPTILAVATLGLGSAAFAQTSPAPSQAPSAAPTAPSTTPSAPSGSDTRSGVTPRSGTSTQSGTATTGKAMTEADVRQELLKQGYSNVSDVKKKGDHFEAKALKDGKQVSLNVDGKTGKVVTR